MIATLHRKLASARQLHATGGLRGIAAELGGRAPFALLRPSHWFGGEQRWMGRLVERAGNVVRVEGCRFDVSHPAIPTRQKSLFLFDRYEIEERRALRRFLDPALPVVEFGGSIGVVACVTNRRLHDPTRHVVVEANPDLVPVLEANRARNGARFTILHRAVAYGADTVRFNLGEFLESSVGRATGRAAEVRTVRLQDVLAETGFERCTLVCDIEGEELALVRHELDVLRRHVATLVLEAHPRFVGEGPTAAMLDALAGAGFEPRFRDQETWVLHNAALAGR